MRTAFLFVSVLLAPHASASCFNEILLRCPTGYVDGCTVDMSLFNDHVCVRERAVKKRAPSCEKEILLRCEKNERDACDQGYSSKHICVLER